MAGQEGRKKETDALTQSLSLPLSQPLTPTQFTFAISHLQHTQSSWAQSLAHSQSPTHYPLQSCQLSCNRKGMSDLSEEEEQFV